MLSAICVQNPNKCVHYFVRISFIVERHFLAHYRRVINWRVDVVALWTRYSLERLPLKTADPQASYRVAGTVACWDRPDK